MHRRYLAIVALILATPIAARAGLAPTKGSQLVNAQANGPCPVAGNAGGNSIAFSLMSNGDGTSSPFVIPPKRIFVITAVNMTIGLEPAGDNIGIVVRIGTAAAGSILAARFEPVTAAGNLSATFDFPSGAVVKSGASICAEMVNFTSGGGITFSAYMQGYFASDK